MTDFNNMTIMAALEVIKSFNSHAELEALEVEWDIHGRCRSDSKSARIVDLAKIAIDENPDVITPDGRMKLERAIVENALTAPRPKRDGSSWKKLLAGLRLDGFDIHEGEQETTPGNFWQPAEVNSRLSLQRMLPDDIPGLDVRAANDEVRSLLQKCRLNVATGHLEQAMSAFSMGQWAGANAQIRTFLESCFDECAERLGCGSDKSAAEKRSFLGTLIPPFLLSDYNEWHGNNQKPQYVQGLMSRLHPHGSHPGLSEEDDCTFRLQIVLITARLFLRRLAGRIK